MADPDPWQTLRVRRRWMVALWIGWLPFGLLLMELQESLLPAPWPFLLALGYLASFWVSSLRFAATRCPRCRRVFAPFFSFQVRGWSRLCNSCGTAIGDPFGPDSGPADMPAA